MASKGDDLALIFHEYSSWKQQAWGGYFDRCDKYAAGFKRSRMWPGTQQARSALRLRTTTELTEALLPRILFNLFYAGGGRFFDVVGLEDDPQSMRNLRERLHFLLTSPDRTGKPALWELHQAVRYGLRYGIQFAEVFWDHAGRRPAARAVSPRHLYWSPNTGSWFDSTRTVLQVRPHRVAQIEGYRDRPGFKIPTESKVRALAERNWKTDDQISIETHASAISQGSRPTAENASKAQRMLNVVTMQTPERDMWGLMAGDDVEVIYDAPNPMGVLTTVGSPFWPVLDSFGGEGVPALMGPEHDLMQTITNSMMDFLELAVLPPMEAGPNSELNVVRQKWGPNVYLVGREGENRPVEVGKFPQEALVQYGESRNRAQRAVGANDLMVTGVPTPSTANRTMAGVRAQETGADDRLFGPLTLFEQQFLTPLLSKLARMDALTARGPVETFDPKSRQFRMVDASRMGEARLIQVRAASRMASRSQLAAAAQTLTPLLLAPQMVEALGQLGKTPDFEELFDLWMDAVGVDRLYALVKELDPQQKQQLDQARNQGKMLDAQSRQEAIRAQGEIDMRKEEMRAEGAADDRRLAIAELLLGASRDPGGAKDAQD